jgi:hypothetical protein
VLIGVLITIVCLIIWYIWAKNYRYSSDRITLRLLPKYNKKLPDDRFLYATEGSVDTLHTTASAKMNQRDANTGNIRDYEIFTLPVREDCALSMMDCVTL